MQNIKLNKDTGGWYTCEVPITKDDWADMLRDKTVASESAMTALLSFYFLPGHGASCTKAAEEYGRKPAYYTGPINGFCRNVQKLLRSPVILRKPGLRQSKDSIS